LTFDDHECILAIMNITAHTIIENKQFRNISKKIEYFSKLDNSFIIQNMKRDEMYIYVLQNDYSTKRRKVHIKFYIHHYIASNSFIKLSNTIFTYSIRVNPSDVNNKSPLDFFPEKLFISDVDNVVLVK
jgi:hypothetical protein